MFVIQPYSEHYRGAVVELILGIQQNEFNVPITIDDQPDLLNIESFYQTAKGNFWLAIAPNGLLVGTIALIDNGDSTGTIRKMFVKAEYRGKSLGTAQQLYGTLEQWAIAHGYESLWLGTLDRLHAALRFYTQNGFWAIEKNALPASFPIMPVDNRFYTKTLGAVEHNH